MSGDVSAVPMHYRSEHSHDIRQSVPPGARARLTQNEIEGQLEKIRLAMHGPSRGSSSVLDSSAGFYAHGRLYRHRCAWRHGSSQDVFDTMVLRSPPRHAAITATTMHRHVRRGRGTGPARRRDGQDEIGLSTTIPITGNSSATSFLRRSRFALTSCTVCRRVRAAATAVPLHRTARCHSHTAFNITINIQSQPCQPHSTRTCDCT